MTYKELYTKFQIEYDKTNLSSYPSLTTEEACAMLDKAYLAIIAQKVTGNNPRKSYLEADIKSISDLQELIQVYVPEETLYQYSEASNVKNTSLPEGFLYYVAAFSKTEDGATPMQIVNHATAKRFFVGPHNKPYIKTPICYIHNNHLFVVYDPDEPVSNIHLTYIKQPESFSSNTTSETLTCSDTVAEEIISLAVIFALESVESTRLNSKLNTKGLEA